MTIIDSAYDLALRHLHKIKNADPGIVIMYEEDGLADHAPNSDVNAAKDAIKQAIIDTGMSAADEGESSVLFTGRALNATRALDAVFALQWARHRNGAQDVGTLYYVYPKGANNVEFCPIYLIFGA